MPLGKLTDYLPAYKSLPLSFAFRATCLTLLLTLVNTPKDPALMIFAVGLVIGTAFENTAVDGLFNKNLKKEIRGSLCGAYNFFGNIGLLIFSGVGGYLYDGIGPKAPLVFVIVCDVVLVIVCVTLRALGKFQ